MILETLEKSMPKDGIVTLEFSKDLFDELFRVDAKTGRQELWLKYKQLYKRRVRDLKRSKDPGTFIRIFITKITMKQIDLGGK